MGRWGCKAHNVPSGHFPPATGSALAGWGGGTKGPVVGKVPTWSVAQLWGFLVKPTQPNHNRGASESCSPPPAPPPSLLQSLKVPAVVLAWRFPFRAPSARSPAAAHPGAQGMSARPLPLPSPGSPSTLSSSSVRRAVCGAQRGAVTCWGTPSQSGWGWVPNLCFPVSLCSWVSAAPGLPATSSMGEFPVAAVTNGHKEVGLEQIYL